MSDTEMTWEEEIYRGFSCPQSGLDKGILNIIQVNYARECTHRFVERFGSHLDQRGTGLTTLLQNWLLQAESFDTVWDLAFGEIRKALLPNKRLDSVYRAAALGLRLHECGLTGEWNLWLQSPTRLRLGHWLLPIANWISVSANAQQISVRSCYKDLTAQTTFWRSAAGWEAEGGEPLPYIQAERNRLILLLPNTLEAIQFDNIPPKLAEDAPELMVSACEAAIALLRDYASIYLSWVDQVIRYIIPLQSENSLRSNRGAGQPGVVHMSFQTEPVALAEMLVHEGTHQYIDIICRLGKIDDGSDSTLYYSPVRRTGRPIRAIVVAYHAFANVLLFYRLCRTSCLADDGYCLCNEEALLPQLKELESALRTTQALTPLGNALWKPLADLIN